MTVFPVCRQHPPVPLAALHVCTYSQAVRVEWDEAKARANLKKHEVDFAGEDSMRKRMVKMHKEYDFSTAKRGPVIPPEPGKTRITMKHSKTTFTGSSLRRCSGR